ERQTTRRLFHPAPWIFTALLSILGATVGGASVHAEDRPVYLSDAAEQGAFNVGTAHAVVNRVFDATAGHDVLKLDHAIPRGTAAGVWTKRFPAPLNADNGDLVRLAVRAADPDQLRHIAMALEIKGG